VYRHAAGAEGISLPEIEPFRPGLDLSEKVLP